ncbi:MAG TPA: hypothetical protein VFS06_06560 [Casimicrobiaceae bacterium]|jgi:antitoxin component of RelBE/YafQ-DinJ toxin-antitoxin module|nr:hypothetical protein [Casimicrobiaceae bacterium]HET9748949.1 hypothetical protein [Casimicrobiaceae bacterium]
MSSVINARLPLRVEQKLADYCAKQGVTKSDVVVRALNRYLNEQAGPVDAYTLAMDLIPAQGVPGLQSDDVRALAQRAFRASRSR